MPPFKPYASARQRRWAHTATGKGALGAEDVAGKDQASKGRALPERAGASAQEHGRRLAAAKMSRRKSAAGPARSFAAHKAAMGALLAVFLLFVPAHATTYYVNAALGNDNNNGTSATTPLATIAKANGLMSAGDVALLYPGTYTDLPNPGTGTEASAQYYFYGNIASPSQVQILPTGQSVTHSHISIAGVWINGDLSLTVNALRDTVRDFVLGQGTSGSSGSMYIQSHYCFIGRGTAYGREFWLGKDQPNAVGNVIDEVTMPNLNKGEAGRGGIAAAIILGGNGGRADSNTVQFCNFTGLMEANEVAGNSNFRSCFLTTHQTWRGNHYTIVTDNSANQNFFIWERDSSQFNNYKADTATVVGPGSMQVELPAGGHYTGSCKNATVDSCFFKFAQTGGFIWIAQDVLNQFKMRYTTILTKSNAAFIAQDIKENTQIHHNTFVAPGNDSYGGVVTFGGESKHSDGTNIAAYNDTVNFSDNILYCTAPAAGPGYYMIPSGLCRKSCDNCPPPSPCFKYGVRWDRSKLDSVHVAGGGVSRKHRINYNLYTCYVDSTRVGDRSIHYTVGGTDYASYPGPVTTPGGGCDYWFRDMKEDSASVYGSPFFGHGYAPDSLVDTFDPSLQQGSAAIAAAEWGTDIGAVAYVTAPLISVTPAILSFTQGLTTTRQFTIQNGGGATLTISSSSSSDNTNFTLNSVPGSVSAGSSAIATVAYSGTGALATITINSNDPKNPVWTFSCVATKTGGPPVDIGP